MSSTIKERIMTFKIDSTDEAWEFAQYLVDRIGLCFYHEETYTVRNDLGMKVMRIPFFKDIERHNILFDLGLLEKPYKQILKDKVNRAIWICDELAPCSFAKMLCNHTESNDNSNIISYMSGEEETEECNRQFNSMMNDFDAWSNIDD